MLQHFTQCTFKCKYGEWSFFLQQFYGQKHKYELEFLLKCYFGKCTCGEQIFKAAVSTTLQMN